MPPPKPKTEKHVIKHEGKEVVPVLYDGKRIGHGKYMAAKYAKDGKLICDKDGKPLQFQQISRT